MGCFVVPAAEAVVSTIVTGVVKAKEKKAADIISAENLIEKNTRIKFSEKLGWLNKMLWGGSALLAFEHVWHGEVSLVFPFFTAVKNGGTAEMLAEMGSTGVLMAIAVTIVWGAMLVISHILEKKSHASEEEIKV